MLFTWGTSNPDGSLGYLGHGNLGEDGTENDENMPQMVTALTESGQRVVAMSCGNDHTAVVTAQGSYGPRVWGTWEHWVLATVTISADASADPG